MKTLKFRKRALLSSVAMLLVAMIALGTATYAWYSINREVTANNISVTASTPGGLEISLTGTSGWGTSVNLEDMDATLNPAQLEYNATGVASVNYGDAAAATASTLKGALNPVSDVEGAAGTYYVMDEVYVRSTSTVPGTVTATVSATGAGSASYTNFALIDADASTPLVEEVTTGATRTGVTALSGTTAEELGSAVSYNAYNGSNATVKHYYVVVYVDGQNENCYTNNATSANVGPISFTLKFTLKDS